MVSRLTGETVIDPNSIELQKRVLAAIAAKLQRSDVIGKDSAYRVTALYILEGAKERGYTQSDLESACRKFVLTRQFGERIEPAHFFDDHVPEKLYPRAWYLKQLTDGSRGHEFDAYLLPGCTVAMYRRHDGRRLSIGTLVSFAGIAVTPPKSPERSMQDEPAQNITTSYLLSKIESLELELKKARRTIGRQAAYIEELRKAAEYAA